VEYPPIDSSTGGAQIQERLRAGRRLFQFEDSIDSQAAASSKPVDVGPSDQYRSRTECYRLDDVAPAADAAVEQYFDPGTNRVYHLRDHLRRRGALSS
jgi:hypothetical protein